MSTPIQADSDGIINGTLTIPGGIIPVGSKKVEFFGGADPDPSYAAAQFVSAGVITVTQRQQVIRRVWERLRAKTGAIFVQQGAYIDPLAQSFAVPAACQLSYADLWFDVAKGGSDVVIQIRDMINGYPGPQVMAESILSPDQIILARDASGNDLSGVRDLILTNRGSGGTDGTYNLSFTGGGGSGAAGTYRVVDGRVVDMTITAHGLGYTSAPTVGFPSVGLVGAAGTATIGNFTRFRFPPITAVPDMQYCIVAMCNDAVWRLRVAGLGEVDGPTQQRISAQPYIVGVLFSSSNNQTWTAHQDKDLQFRLGGPSHTVTTRTVRLSPQGKLTSATIAAAGANGTNGTFPLEITGTGLGAKGTFTVSGQSVTAIDITEPGSGYTAGTTLGLDASAGLTGAAATAVLTDYPVTNCDYIGLMGAMDLPSNDTSIQFRATLPTAETVNLTLNDFTLLPSRITGNIVIEAILTGTESLTPVLYPDLQILAGTTNLSSVYESRTVNITKRSGSTAPTKVVLLYDWRAPGGATVTAEVRDDENDAWVPLVLDDTAGLLPMADDWSERLLTIDDLDTANTSTKLRITLTGTAWARPEIRRLRLICQENTP
jgi:hypothetical protein